MKQFLTLPLTACLFLASLTVSSSALALHTRPMKPPDTRPKSRTVFTLEAGLVTGGDVYLNNERAGTTDDNFSGGIGVEFPAHGLIASGVALDLHDISSQGYGRAQFWNVSVNFKRTLKDHVSGPFPRPGFEIGWGRIHAFDNNGNFITYKLYLEMDIVGKAGPGCFLEFGMIAAPYGKPEGIAGDKISADLRPIFRAGLLFR